MCTYAAILFQDIENIYRKADGSVMNGREYMPNITNPLQYVVSVIGI
jgi:hypothetical protein